MILQVRGVVRYGVEAILPGDEMFCQAPKETAVGLRARVLLRGWWGVQRRGNKEEEEGKEEGGGIKHQQCSAPAEGCEMGSRERCVCCAVASLQKLPEEGGGGALALHGKQQCRQLRLEVGKVVDR